LCGWETQKEIQEVLKKYMSKSYIFFCYVTDVYLRNEWHIARAFHTFLTFFFFFLGEYRPSVKREKRLEGIENQRPLIIELRKHKWNKNILPFLFKKEN